MADIVLKQNHKTAPRGVIRIVMIIGLVGLFILVSGIAYIWFSGGDGRASAPIAAPELSVAPGDSRVLFRIVPVESEVRFRIDETLLGEPKTVVGTTSQVAGDLLVDFEDPANSQLGLIRINVRTLTTDNEFRNRALRGQILEADHEAFEYAEFVATTLTGLPDVINIGDTVNFQISGTLTVHGVSRSVTFDATLTAISESRLEGSATATVRYPDFDITVPEAPGVANVSEEVGLEIDFVAIVAGDNS